MLRKIKKNLTRLVERDRHAGLLRVVKPYTLCSPRKLRTLIELAELANRLGIEGDFVECGACNGGSGAVLASLLGPKRRLWLYDSFQGMPKPGERDGETSKDFEKQCLGTIDNVREVLAKVGLPAERCTIRAGWFQETFQQPLPDKVALLHCDADWYDSVTLVLDTFYSRIPPGGCVVLDDFGYWEGCREAFYDFCSRTQERPLLERVSCDQAYWVRGKEHNRKAA
jgi:O-methyltransferase